MELNTIYNILKTEYWPYRYYFMIIIIFFLTFIWDIIICVNNSFILNLNYYNKIV